MTTLLVRNASVLATMDEHLGEIRDGGLYVEGGVIRAVGPSTSLPVTAEHVLDLSGHVVTPGLVNTHHHLFQNLTRVLPAAQDAPLFDWLRPLFAVWSGLDPRAVRVATEVGLAELLLSGCTTTSDHLYIYPNGVRLEDTIEVALGIGMRFHATRGSMSIGESGGGLAPDSLVEAEPDILSDSRRVIESFHDAAPFAMTRIALAPCSPFVVSQDLMRESAAMARAYGVRLHSHLAENAQDIDYLREVFGQRPGEYMQALGWVGEDVWHAHCVHLDEAEIGLFARTRTGVAHCPGSNMRLGSGIAPLRRMLDQDVPVGLGVDGSSSNDAAHVMGEARLAMLLARVTQGAEALSAREALRVATLGGAKVLGRDDIGALRPGMAADFAAYDLRGLAFAGSESDPLAALVLCGPPNAAFTVVAGRVRVAESRLVDLDLPGLLARHHAAAVALVRGEA